MSLDYLVRNEKAISFNSSSNVECTLDAVRILSAVEKTHEVVDQIEGFDVKISELLGMRNLSAFIGELFVSRFANVYEELFFKNPHQDGYPDLLLMDDNGRRQLENISAQNGMKKKGPFSPFLNGGIEVKATCGSVPSPEQCSKKGFEKPGLNDQRIELMKGYDWKAHHRETNNLIGLLWDFIGRKPRIVALFFCSDLTEQDWGKIIKPRSGGGRTTSVSIMTRDGVQKMYRNWVLVLNDRRYIDFLNSFNKLSLL